MPASPIVFMFSGQGSQYFHMGRDLFQKNETFRSWMVCLDAVVQRSSSISVIETLYSSGRRKSDLFDRTLLTNPAIFMVEYALAQTLIEAGLQPDMVLGTSLGTFAAAAVAGILEVEEALTSVIQMAIAFERHCKAGGMIVVLEAPALFAQGFLSETSELVAINFASHFVVSARQRNLAHIELDLKERNVGYQRLAVSFPFHTKWIEQAKEAIVACTGSMRYRAARIPLICCEQAAVLSELCADYFWNVVRRPIRFRDTIAWLERKGAYHYVDVGPAGTLATFLKYGLPATSRSTVHAILTPFGQDEKNLATLLASLAAGSREPLAAR